jgi:hypothetical protein
MEGEKYETKPQSMSETKQRAQPNSPVDIGPHTPAMEGFRARA